MRIILPSQKYDEALITTNITSLRDRREKLCEHFFEKNIDNENLKDLLPQTILSGYDLSKYHNYICRTERFKNSFLPQSILKRSTVNKLFLFYCFNSFIERCSNGKSANGTRDPCEALSLLNFVYI